MSRPRLTDAQLEALGGAALLDLEVVRGLLDRLRADAARGCVVTAQHLSNVRGFVDRVEDRVQRLIGVHNASASRSEVGQYETPFL